MSIERATCTGFIPSFKKWIIIGKFCKQIRIWLSFLAINYSFASLWGTQVITSCFIKSLIYLLTIRISRIQILSYTTSFVNTWHSKGGRVKSRNFGYFKNLYESNRCSTTADWFSDNGSSWVPWRRPDRRSVCQAQKSVRCGRELWVDTWKFGKC